MSDAPSKKDVPSGLEMIVIFFVADIPAFIGYALGSHWGLSEGQARGCGFVALLLFVVVYISVRKRMISN
jgi:hypothetical protein